MTRTPRGFTLIELLIVVAIIGIIAAIALPGLARARMSANESSAVGSMRAVYSGQQTFWSSCGSGNYSPSLQNLGLNVAAKAGFISPDLAGPAPVVKSGYLIQMGAGAAGVGTSCNGGTVALSYRATADPTANLGRRYFGTNSGGTIFESDASLAGSMPDTGAPPAPAHPLQ